MIPESFYLVSWRVAVMESSASSIERGIPRFVEISRNSVSFDSPTMSIQQINDFLHGDFSSSEYVQKARALVPVLKQRAQQQWETPKILDETIADLQDAGFFQMLQPRRWGGAETTPIESFEVTSILAEGDPSVGWVLGVIGIHHYHLAFFEERAPE